MVPNDAFTTQKSILEVSINVDLVNPIGKVRHTTKIGGDGERVIEILKRCENSNPLANAEL